MKELDRNGFFLMADGTKSCDHTVILKKRKNKKNKEEKKSKKSNKIAKTGENGDM